jgi:hypothetical protein
MKKKRIQSLRSFASIEREAYAAARREEREVSIIATASVLALLYFAGVVLYRLAS